MVQGADSAPCFYMVFMSSLIKIIKDKSYSDLNFLEAWKFSYYFFKNQTHCLCGRPIKHCYVFRNKLNGNQIVLGSGCMDIFFGFPMESLKNRIELVSDKELKILYEAGFISEWVSRFLGSLKNYKNLTIKQTHLLSKIRSRLP